VPPTLALRPGQTPRLTCLHGTGLWALCASLMLRASPEVCFLSPATAAPAALPNEAAYDHHLRRRSQLQGNADKDNQLGLCHTTSYLDREAAKIGVRYCKVQDRVLQWVRYCIGLRYWEMLSVEGYACCTA